MINISLAFPGNPSHGDVFEYKKGLLYQFDASINGWVEIQSNSVNLELATPVRKGAMSASDLQKLNRLVLPPPQSTITGNNCIAPFQKGMIQLFSGDKFVNVNGNVDIRNIDEFGNTIIENRPFHIHQHTYGFDFTLDLPGLVQELLSRGQIDLQGRQGKRGEQGDRGDPGINEILSGPAGEQGEQGFAPPCDLSIDPEPINAEARPGLKRALVSARLIDHSTDKSRYILEFDRQVIGAEASAASKINVKSSNSYWVLATSSIAGGTQNVYYIDIEPIIEAVHTKFLSEVDRLKKGYEDIVEFWIQTMSDLFDEQKAALCCALEYCMSVRKSIDQRQHMESVAAAAVGANGAKINLHGRDSNEAQTLSHTRLLARMPDGEDLCSGGSQFPQDSSSNIAFKSATPEQILINVDPLLNITTIRAAAKVELPKGHYRCYIKETDARVAGKYGVPLKIQYANNGSKKVIQFLDKGSFNSLMDAKSAYEGLSLAFNHDGGYVYIYYPIMPMSDASGNTIIAIQNDSDHISNQVIKADKVKLKQSNRIEPIQSANDPLICHMDSSHLHWYKKGWDNSICCGIVVNIGDQDYIIFKRSVGDDDACGGGESESTPCLKLVKETTNQYPAFAWPTLDGKTFTNIPNGKIRFRYDEKLSKIVQDKINTAEYDNPKGNPAGFRHLAHQLQIILFPTI